ncbi:MAG: hypothetical protein AB1782_01310 [Cyanobacteriota bacterium]
MNWDEGIFNSANWLYDLHIPSHGYGIIHIPLLYLTKLRIQHEIYAGALVDFPALLGLNSIFQPFIIDGAVVKFPLHSYENFRGNCFGLITNSKTIQTKLAKQMIFLKLWLPKLCLKAEKQFISEQKVSSILLNRLYRMLIRCVAINLTNPFAEIIFIKANKIYQNDEYYKSLVSSIVWPPIFSNMTYIENEYLTLQTLADQKKIEAKDIHDFCWARAFLKNSTGDGSEYESPVFVAKEIKADELINILINNDINTNVLFLPDINLDPSELTTIWRDNDNNLERMLLLLRFLQVNEEFRHYWGIRIIRLFRLIAPDKKARECWSISDYEEYSKK